MITWGLKGELWQFEVAAIEVRGENNDGGK